MTALGKTSAGARALRRAAGDALIVGLEGVSLSAIEAAWLKLIRPAGVILFRRNVEDPEQTHALLKAAKDAAADGSEEAPLLRAIDVEGGTVDRLRDLIAPMPSALTVSRTRDAGLFSAHGQLIAREARLLGLNATFAPVLDLRTAASAGVLTTRAVSSDPAEVVRYAGCFLEGLAKEGVLGCGKHFPGLGSGDADSHQSTPRIDVSFEQLWKEDLWPYRKLAARLALVMISHACYPRTRSGAEPASISRFWVTEILKKRIGFRGLIVSDDMEMGGILSQINLPGAVVAGLLAGVHLIEVCRDPALVMAAYEALLSEAERSPAFARRLLAASAKSRALRGESLERKYFPRRPAPGAVNQVRAEIRRFSDTVRRSEQAPIDRGDGGAPQ